ncbi:B12-binding domain-containing radical SAM protein [Alicyclobacillus fastidiosus]|uniref:B12-binding domain-containing radical SAM protein n=1 Tax=Alicyclobacillus fastidiosus TaxID=392011 RepID=A0ABV5AL57_9BACL|nr:B12-binding domain-containing radical SAM protein [Alicyclobacillus fastidiosus]WEH08855.1 B12-binding domain-containing radical SAM protein [Alicyclobacillus fastidiosus]
MNVILTTLNAKYIHSSLALRYLRTYVEKDFPSTQIREYTMKDPATQIVADLYTQKPDVIAFSVYIWNVEETLPLLSMLKKVLPDTSIVLGGPEVSYDTRHWMERCPAIDCIVQGEGEGTFHHLLTTLDRGESLREVNGLVYRENGQVRTNPARPKLDLHQIPSPYQDDADIASLRNRVVYYETSRGCPFSCQFCLSSIESGVRYFPLERVKADLKLLIDSGIKTIKFVDRTFNLKRQYALDLFQFLIDNRGDTVFQFEITGDILPTEIVDFLKEHAPQGLFRFEIGVQSTNDLTNTLVKRRQNFARLRDTILAVKASGKIVQHLDLIAGLPEEDYGSFKKTFNDVFAFEPDELQLGFLKMLRGTGMRQRAPEFGYVFMDRAPYEIFSNHVLSYDDVLRIKQVEDVLEKYWNEGKLRHTVQYLTRHVFPSPFDFFQMFGHYWESQGWSKIGHQLEDLFVRLDDFLMTVRQIDERHAARSYMMYDFLLQHRVRPHKVWWEKRLGRGARSRLAAWIFDHPQWFGPDFARLQLTRSDIEKHTVLEVLPRLIHPQNPDHPPQDESGLLLFYYPPGLQRGQQPTPYVSPLPKQAQILCS